MAKKLAEEAIEVVIDAVKGNSAAVIRERRSALQSGGLGGLRRRAGRCVGGNDAARAIARHRRKAAEAAESQRRQAGMPRPPAPSPPPQFRPAVRWPCRRFATRRSGVEAV